MQRGNLVTDVKSLIGKGHDLSDSEIITWINDAYMQMVDEIIKVNPDYFNKSVTTASYNGQREYVLPDDFVKITNVNIKHAGEWVRVLPMGNADKRFIPIIAETEDQGFLWSEPKYYVNGGRLGIMPIPDETTTDAIEIWYTYTPTTLDLDTDEPAIPEQYHRYIKYCAYANWLDRDDEHVSAERARNRFDGLVARMVETLSNQQEDEVRRVERSENLDLYSFNNH